MLESDVGEVCRFLVSGDQFKQRKFYRELPQAMGGTQLGFTRCVLKEFLASKEFKPEI